VFTEQFVVLGEVAQTSVRVGEPSCDCRVERQQKATHPTALRGVEAAIRDLIAASDQGIHGLTKVFPIIECHRARLPVLERLRHDTPLCRNVP